MTDKSPTLQEVAECLKLTEKVSYHLTTESRLPVFKVGDGCRFNRDAWIEPQKNNN